MFEKIEEVIARNNLKYHVDGSTLKLKPGRGVGTVKIKYDYATESYLYNCDEYRLILASFLMFSLAFNRLFQPEQQVWSGAVTGLLFALAILGLFQILLAHIQILDIKTQLRDVDIYLKPDF